MLSWLKPDYEGEKYKKIVDTIAQIENESQRKETYVA